MTSDNKEQTIPQSTKQWVPSQKELDEMLEEALADLEEPHNFTVKRMTERTSSKETPKEVTFIMKSKAVKPASKTVAAKANTEEEVVIKDAPQEIPDITNTDVDDKQEGAIETGDKDVWSKIILGFNKRGEAIYTKEPVYFLYDIEDVMFRYDPAKNVYFTKFKGDKEFQTHPDSNFLWEGQHGRDLKTKDDYEAY
jgi:hypothetical protein